MLLEIVQRKPAEAVTTRERESPSKIIRII